MSSEYMNSAIIGGGIAICGISPAAILSTIDPEPCDDCETGRVVRKFSGSGWYEDSFLCLDCGFDVGTGYKPFKPRWRDENKKRAAAWLEFTVDHEQFYDKTAELIREEMGWDED